MNFNFKHEWIETNIGLLAVLTMLAISVGGSVEITPLFFIDKTIEKVDGVRPYTPLEQAGRDIYVREGCYVCHSQMIRPFRDETLRYGHYSLAAESMFDHPFQWGSERTGPDLARVGDKYSSTWQVDHLMNPRAVVPESIMPSYAFLAKADLSYDDIAGRLHANAVVGVPYSDEMVKDAVADLIAQATPGSSATGIETRYPKVRIEDFDGDPKRITEMDALVAYLQMLGTLVDFTTYDEKSNER